MKCPAIGAKALAVRTPERSGAAWGAAGVVYRHRPLVRRFDANGQDTGPCRAAMTSQPRGISSDVLIFCERGRHPFSDFTHGERPLTAMILHVFIYGGHIIADAAGALVDLLHARCINLRVH
jgi:hypothetical protein